MDVRWEKNEYEEDVKITTLPNGAEIRELASKGVVPEIPQPPSEFGQILISLQEIKDSLKALMEAHQIPKSPPESGGI
jgi:hypothetical protein